jgi:hypothetical protein
VAQYYDTDLGASALSKQELDQIALAGGRIGSIGFGYACAGELPAELHGYGFKWLDTRGMGNHGYLVLTARSQRAAEYLRQGKVGQFMADLGLGYQQADALYSACRGVRHGFEQEVLAYAVETRECREAWARFPGAGRGVRRWLVEWSMPETALSVPRLAAVAEILAAWPSEEG